MPPLVFIQTTTFTPIAPESITIGTLLSVWDAGVLVVQMSDGQVVTATQCTDEPLVAGQSVWITQTTSGAVVLGSA